MMSWESTEQLPPSLPALQAGWSRAGWFGPTRWADSTPMPMPTPDPHHQYVERVVDLLDPNGNRIVNMSVEEARSRVGSTQPEAVRDIEGSFALVARAGKRVRLARSLDRPMRYFLAKREEGPALIVADRVDAIQAWLKQEGFERQFHPSYTRMVPAHHVVEIHLIGCPDPDPVYARFFTHDYEHATEAEFMDLIGRCERVHQDKHSRAP